MKKMKKTTNKNKNSFKNSSLLFIFYLFSDTIIKKINFFSPVISVIFIIINCKIEDYRNNKNGDLPDAFASNFQLINDYYLDFAVRRYRYLLDYALSNTLLYNVRNEIILKCKNPKISVVISVYNREKYIKSTLTSVQNQNLRDIEIIFVDDFSIDNSVKILQEEMFKDKRIKLFKNEKNMGTLYTNHLEQEWQKVNMFYLLIQTIFYYLIIY